MKKRILGILITLVMLIGLVSVMSISASAETYSTTVSLGELRQGDIIYEGTTITFLTTGMARRIHLYPSKSLSGDYTVMEELPRGTEQWTSDADYYVIIADNFSSLALRVYKLPSSDITFYPDGGTFGDSATTKVVKAVQETSKNSDVSSLTPTKTGYTFLGWYTGDYSEQVYDAQGKAVNGTYWNNNIWQGAGDKDFIAKWQAKAYTVSFDANGGSVGTTKKIVTYDSAYGTLPTPTRTGYTFAGWYTSASSGTKVTESTKVQTASKHTVYAHWTPNTYGVTLNTNGSTINSGNVTSYTYGTGATLPSNVTKTGYTFGGWYENSDFSGSAVISIGTTAMGAKTYYAKWTPNTYTVNFNANGGTINSGNVTSYTYGTGATLPGNVTKTGYTFGGWYENSDFSGSAVTSIGTTAIGAKTYYAKWTPNTYTVNFNANGGTINSGNVTSYTYGTTTTLPSNVTKTGYTFGGWYENSDFSGSAVTSIGTTAIGAKTYYAKWTPNTYTVNFNANGGTINSGNVTSYTYGTGATLPTNVTKTGYTFSGWYASADFSGSAVTTVDTTETGDKTYYAKWTANTYTVNFNANGGSVSTTSNTVTYDSAYGTLPTPTRTGYTFVGWYTDSVNGNKVESSTAVTITDTQTLYAHWEKIVYNATLGESLHGSVNIPTANATMDDPVAVIITPYEGYEVDAVTFNGVAATKVSENNYTFTMPAADAVVAVTYKKIPYTVTLINDGTAAGGSFSVDMSTATIGDTVTITVNSNLGYFIGAVTFNGAAATNNGDGTYSFTMPAQNVSVMVAFDVDLPAIAKELQLLNDADVALQTAISNGDNDLTAEISALSTAITKAQDAIDDLDNGYATDAQLGELKSALEAAENTMTTAINALKDRVTEIENQLSGIDLSQIATNKQEIANLTTELDAVKDTVDQLDNTFINNTELSDALGNLKAELDGADNALKALITALDGRVEDIEDALDGIDLTQIAKNKTAISALTTELGTLNTLVNTLQTNYANADANLQAQIDTLAAKLTELINETIAELTDSVNKLKDDLNTANGKINTNASDVATLKNDVSTLKTWKDNAQSAIEALETLTGTQSGDINTLKAAVRDLISAMDSAEAKITAAENRIATLEGQVSALETAKQELEDAVSTLQTAVATKADKATVNAAIADLQAAIDALEAVKDDYATADATLKAELETAITTAKGAAITAANNALAAAKNELNAAIALKADATTLNAKVAELTAAISNAETVAKAYADSQDAALKSELETAIATAKSDLETLIGGVQSDLDTTKAKLDKAIDDLNKAITDGDKDLSDKIAALNTALTNAKEALEKADADNKAELVSKIETADATLDAAIKAVQKNLDDAKTALNKAIADGDTALDNKISALNEALATAKAALEATDSANKSELTTKIDEADAALQAAIDALSNELNATNEKVAELETFIIIVCVISGVAFCGCGTLAVFYMIDKKKKI